MLRTFVDIYGNIQYVPFNAYPNQTNTLLQPIIYNDPYANSSLIVSPDYSDDNSIIGMSIPSGLQPSVLNGYNVFQRPIFYTNPIKSDVNNDPELRKKIVRFFFEKFANIWLPQSYIKLQRYLKVSNGQVTFIKTVSDYDKELVNDDKKVEFILENIFSKHELLVFLEKFVNRYNVNWYDLKTKHYEKVKSEIYEKLKNHMKKIVMDQI